LYFSNNLFSCIKIQRIAYAVSATFGTRIGVFDFILPVVIKLLDLLSFKCLFISLFHLATVFDFILPVVIKLLKLLSFKCLSISLFHLATVFDFILPVVIKLLELLSFKCLFISLFHLATRRTNEVFLNNTCCNMYPGHHS